MKDLSLRLFAEKSVHGAKVEFGPCELMGFGTGTLTGATYDALEGILTWCLVLSTVWGLGFKVWVWALGFGVWGLGIGVLGFGL